MVSNLFTGLQQLVYPTICEGCGEHLSIQETGICLSCLQTLPYTRHEQTQENYLLHRFSGRVPLQNAASLLFFFQGSISQRIMHAIKYRGATDLAHWMGSHMGSRLSAANTGGFGDAELVPVPLHPQKKILRGYNQSELIADGIASTTGMPVNNLALFREVNKTSQTRKSRSERWEEIQHDFIAESNVVKGKNLILVDDVCTTGATVEACALTLLNAGASSVGLLTLAFASDFFV